jgi:hypothetical protein
LKNDASAPWALFLLFIGNKIFNLFCVVLSCTTYLGVTDVAKSKLSKKIGTHHKCKIEILITIWKPKLPVLRNWIYLGKQGCQILLDTIYQKGGNIPNDHKLYQTSINYTKWPNNILNGHKIYRHFPYEGTPNFTKIGIFGLKINHLATLYVGKESLFNAAAASLFKTVDKQLKVFLQL